MGLLQVLNKNTHEILKNDVLPTLYICNQIRSSWAWYIVQIPIY